MEATGRELQEALDGGTRKGFVWPQSRGGRHLGVGLPSAGHWEQVRTRAQAARTWVTLPG